MDKLFDKITFEDTQGHPSTHKVWDSDAARIISEFTMAERRQNLMSGDGYNTIYAKLSRWYEDFKPIVFSGSYTDLEDKPTIPNVYNGTLEIKRNGVSVQTFSANSALNVIANIEVPEIDDNVSSATTLYSSQRIDQLIQELGPNIINNNDDTYEIDADTINQITEQVLQRIVVPSAEVDYTTIYSYIDSHMPTVGNGKLTVTVNGAKSIAQVSNGVSALLPDASNFFSANQTEDVELNLDIPQPIELIDNTTYSDNRTWSSNKIRSEILASGSLRMVVLAAGTSHTDIIGEGNTIYFERITNDDPYNQYEEWIWTGDAWENIGRQIVDLSDYALKSEIGNATIRVVQNNTILGSFTTNQMAGETPVTIEIPTPNIGNGTITITQGTDTVSENGVDTQVPHVIGTFTVNQNGNTTLNIPEPEEPVQSDWNENDNTSMAYIRNKPNIPVVNDGTLSIQYGNNTPQTFTANQAGNTTVIIPEAPQQVQSDWNQSDSSANDYIKNKPSFAGIKVVDASGLTSGVLQTNANVNDLVVLSNTSSSVTYTYTNNAGTEKHLKGNPDYDIVFRYCGNNKFQPITLPIPID